MVSGRLEAWIRERFGSEDIEPVLGLLADVVPHEPGATVEGVERIQAAVVFLSGGDGQRLLDALALAQPDWRDVLVAVELADDDWADRLDAALGKCGGSRL